MTRLSRLRRALGFIVEGDPGAWRCDFCRRWTDGDICLNHRMRVMREPNTPRPSAPSMPPPPVINVRIVP